MGKIEKSNLQIEEKNENQEFIYKENNWYKKLNLEQQLKIDQKFKEKYKLDQKITQIKSSIEYKTINREIIMKDIQDEKIKYLSNEKLTISERIDILDREIDILLGEIYNINYKKNYSELMSSFNKSNQYFINKLQKLSETNEFAKKLIETNKDLSNISSGDIYSLKQEKLDLSSLFLIKTYYKEYKVNFGKNKNLNNYIGAGDLLDIYKIDKVKINGVEGERKFIPRPGYYAKNGKYLTIFDNYKIEIISENKIIQKQEKNNYDNAFLSRYKEIRSDELFEKFRDVLNEKGNRSFVKFEWISKNDLDLIYGYISKFINIGDVSKIVYIKDSGVLKTVGGESLNKVIPHERLGKGYEKYKDIVKEVAKQEKIPVNKLITLINHENIWWDPLRGNPKSSAFGLGQMLDGTWERFGKDFNKSNPKHQLIAVCRYLNHIKITKNCSIELAMAYYNTGEAILKVSNVFAKKMVRLNPPIKNKIPFGMMINPDVYFTGAVAYYNDIDYRDAVKLINLNS